MATGNSLDEISPYLPKIPRTWPQVEKQKHSDQSAHIKTLNAQSKIAETEIEIENSKAWPTLQVGPAVMIEQQGDTRNEMLGVSLNLPLPLFQTNGGGKAYARSNHLKAKKIVELTHAFESHERFEQLQVYESTVESLESSLSTTRLLQKHSRLTKLYERGVISNEVYLDSIEKKLSFIQRKNQRIMTALKSLWNIYKFNGKVMDKDIL